MTLLDSVQESCSFGIVDDYEHWDSHGRPADAGKLLLIDDADYETQHIFFDDHISDNPLDSIVDVRDLITGETIPYKRAVNKFMVRVESDKAILEPDYFTKKIEECEKRRSEEIDMMEKGISLEKEEVEIKKVDDWTLLHQLGSNDYLTKTVLPVIYQGLRNIDIERPRDPIKALAFYMLKNKGLVKLPEPKKEEIAVEEKKEINEIKEEKKIEEKKEEKVEEVKEEIKKAEAKKEAKKIETKKEIKKAEEKKVEAKKTAKKA